MVDNSAHPLWGISSGLEPSLGWGRVLRTLESNKKRKAVIPVKPCEEALGPVCTPGFLVVFHECCVCLGDAHNMALGDPSECYTLEVLVLEYEARMCTEELLSADPVPVPQWKPFNTGQFWGTAVQLL